MTNSVNIFLDSTVLFNDPFFKGSFSKLLLSLSQKAKIQLYVSEVVFNESLNNYTKNVKEINGKIRKELRNLNQITDSSIEFCCGDLSTYVSKYKEYYDSKINDGTFIEVSNKEGVLAELLHRSINRIKPFTEARQEFRDAVIWLSYVDVIKRQNLQNNFFITNNKRDFWNDDNSDLHHELKQDVSDLKVYSNFQEICQTERVILDIVKEHDFSKWLADKNFSKSDIYSLLKRNSMDLIRNEISTKINKLNPREYFPQVEASYFEYSFHNEDIEIDNYQISQISNFAFVECFFSIPGQAIFYPYGKIWYKEKRNIFFKINASFTFTKTLLVQDFLVKEIELTSN